MTITKTIKFGVLLTEEQKRDFNRIMGCFRFVWNAYIEEAERRHGCGESFITDRKFSATKRKELMAEHEWLDECPKHPINYVLQSVYNAYKKFFKNPGPTGKPKFKSKYRNPINSYVSDSCHVRLNPDKGTVKISHFKEFTICRRELKRLKNQEIAKIWNAKLVRDTLGNFVICLTIEDPTWDMLDGRAGTSRAIGIDVGLVKLATLSDGRVYENPCRFNKRYLHADKMIRRLQNIISRKAKIKYSRGIRGRDVYHSKTQDKLWYRVRKYYQIKVNIIHDTIKKICHEIVAARPIYVNIEDLKIQEMTKGKGRRIQREIRAANLYYFREFMIHKCREYRVPIHLVPTDFPSTKKCSCCGKVKKKEDYRLTKGRLYVCKCGHKMDRDLNAAINILRCENVTLASDDAGLLAG